MLKKVSILLPVLAVMALVFGCQSGPNLSESQSPTPTLATARLSAAMIESATLNLYVSGTNDQDVNVHRVTADWDEMTVTWNNFGGAYDAAVEGSFFNDQLGYIQIDITGLVQGWLDEAYPNYGLLLDQPVTETLRGMYHSREGANAPFLEICYMGSSGLECEQFVSIADAYIWEIAGIYNYGAEPALFTGWITPTSLEKQSLIRFEIPTTPPDSGCTRTIGYWKNHPEDMSGFSIWLGDEGGAKSLEVTDAAMAVAVLKMKTYGSNKNGITKLYAQLLATKLNHINGASGGALGAAVAEADAFLAEYDYTDWDDLSDEMQDYVLDLKDLFDDYNNGYIGPGHCD